MEEKVKVKEEVDMRLEEEVDMKLEEWKMEGVKLEMAGDVNVEEEVEDDVDV